MEDHKPLLSRGFISHNGSSAVKPVQILNDTGAAQVLLLENVLPLCKQTSTVGAVLFQGVELSAIDNIYLKSYLITGPIIVGVWPTIPVKGVSLLPGNDLVGGKVIPDPIFYEKITSNIASNDEEDHALFQESYVHLLKGAWYGKLGTTRMFDLHFKKRTYHHLRLQK